MKQRRTINASDSVDPQDYVTRAELDALRADLTNQIDNLKGYVNILVSGVNMTSTVIDGIFVGFVTLQYKDWAGANQSATVVNSTTFTSHTETFSRGLRKA